MNLSAPNTVVPDPVQRLGEKRGERKSDSKQGGTKKKARSGPGGARSSVEEKSAFRMYQEAFLNSDAPFLKGVRAFGVITDIELWREILEYV